MDNKSSVLRILHTSDWHLGKQLHKYDRSIEYDFFRESLIDAIANGHPDMLLIAGDIFDNVSPSFNTEKYFGKTINTIIRQFPDLHVIITSGNHDSERKIENISIYMETCEKLKIVGELPTTESGENSSNVELNYEALVYPAYSKEHVLKAVTVAMPYLTPIAAGNISLNKETDNYEIQTRNIYQACLRYIHDKYPETREKIVPVIAMGHFFVKKSDIGEQDEASVNIMGGEGQVDSSIFDGYDYVALGHIHLRQNITKSRHIRYSGSPLPINFGELEYDNGLDMIDLIPCNSTEGKKGFDISVTTHPVSRTVQFIRIPEGHGVGSEDEVLSDLNSIIPNTGKTAREKNPGGLPFLSVYAEYDPEHSSFNSSTEFRDHLDKILNNLRTAVRICEVKITTKTSDNSITDRSSQVVESLDDISNPLKLAARMYGEINNGAEMPPELQDLISDIIREAEGLVDTSSENA